jgi:branched-chain amino acid transport system substrate-binding protein
METSMKKFLAALRALSLGVPLLVSQLAGATTIVVGQVAPLSGLDANQGRAYAVGMQLYFNTSTLCARTTAAGRMTP